MWQVTSINRKGEFQWSYFYYKFMAKLCARVAKWKGYTEIEISEFNTAKTMVEWNDSSPSACRVCSNNSCLGELANGVEPTCKYAKERFKDLK